MLTVASASIGRCFMSQSYHGGEDVLVEGRRHSQLSGLKVNKQAEGHPPWDENRKQETRSTPRSASSETQQRIQPVWA